jgi:betaine reductase
VHIATVVPISKMIGANRILPGVSIPHPTGYPEMDPASEKKARIELIRRALDALATSVDAQTVF